MPDTLKHRGKNPKDNKLFVASKLPFLRQAVNDLAFLQERGYTLKSSIKLVGDRYNLTARQRMAVERCSCSDRNVKNRQEKCITLESCKNQVLMIDGYNLLITVESSLSAGLVFKARDGAYRDIASIHGTYRKVAETGPAIELIGRKLEEFQIKKAEWFLDAPVSNSGRLKMLLLEYAARNHWNWDVQVVNNPDRCLVESENIVVSSDSWILDHCRKWLNLCESLIQNPISLVEVIDKP